MPQRPTDKLPAPDSAQDTAAQSALVAASRQLDEQRTNLASALEKRQEVPAAPPVADDPLSKRKISITMQNVRVGQLLWILAKDFGLSLSIDSAVLEMARTINLYLKDVTGRQALDHILQSFDVYARVGQDGVLSVSLHQEQVFDVASLAGRSTLELNSGGDAFGGGKDAGTGMKNNLLFKSDLGDKTDGLDYLVKSVETIVAETSGAAVSSTQAVDPREKARFSLNRATSSLYIKARPSIVRSVGLLVERETSFRKQQVQIEAQLLDVQLNDQSRLGIDWNLFGSKLLGRFGAEPLSIGSSASTTAGRSLPSDAKVIIPGQLLGTPGQTAGGIGYRTNSFSVAINALKAFGAVRLLSNPSILVRNGMPAYLNVGNTIRYVQKITTTTNVSSGGSTTSMDVVTDSVFSGVVIGVSAVIKKDGLIEVFIHPSQTRVRDASLQLVDVGGGNKVTLPIVNTKGLATTLNIQSGDTVIIGGLIDKQDDGSVSGLPRVSELPGVGAAFSTDSTQKSTRELVMLLRARAI